MRSGRRHGRAAATSTSDAPSTTRMPTPEIGLFDEPMRPAMYPATAAMTAPITTHVDQADRRSSPTGLSAIGVLGQEQPQQEGDRDQGGQDVPATMPIGRSRSVSVDRAPPVRRALRRRGGRPDAAHDRAEDLEQRPDRGDGDRAGADEPDLGAERAGDDVARSRRSRARRPLVSVGSSTAVARSAGPTTMAAPTVTPTRCPTPISASDRLAPNRSSRPPRAGTPPTSRC